MDEARLLRYGLLAVHAIVNDESFVADVCHDWQERTPSVTLAGEPGTLTVAEIDRWMRLSADDLYIVNLLATGDPRSYRTSDFMTFNRFRQTTVYREVFAQYEMHHLLVMTPRITDQDLLLIGLTRRLHDFSDRETRGPPSTARPHRHSTGLPGPDRRNSGQDPHRRARHPPTPAHPDPTRKPGTRADSHRPHQRPGHPQARHQPPHHPQTPRRRLRQSQRPQPRRHRRMAAPPTPPTITAVVLGLPGGVPFSGAARGWSTRSFYRDLVTATSGKAANLQAAYLWTLTVTTFTATHSGSCAAT
jgi:hypothetical protein